MALIFEDIIYDISSYISSNYATYLALVNAEVEDGYTISDFKEIVEFKFDVLDGGSKYSRLNIIPGPIDVEEVALGIDKITQHITFAIADRHPKEDVAKKKILRHADALRRAINADNTAAGAADYIRITKIEPFDKGDNDIICCLVEAVAEKEQER